MTGDERINVIFLVWHRIVPQPLNAVQDEYSDTTGAVRYIAIYEKGDISVHFNYTWSNAAFFSVELPKDDDFESVEYTTANGNTFTYVKNIDWWEAELFSGGADYGIGSDCSEEEFRAILEKIGRID